MPHTREPEFCGSPLEKHVFPARGCLLHLLLRPSAPSIVPAYHFSLLSTCPHVQVQFAVIALFSDLLSEMIRTPIVPVGIMVRMP